MAEEVRFSSPEEEIKYLEQKIIERRQEITERGVVSVVGEVVRDHIASIPTPVQQIVPPVTGIQNPHAVSDEHVQAYVNVVMEHGVEEAVRQIRMTHNPHLIDAFHDALVDQFIDTLRARGMLGA